MNRFHNRDAENPILNVCWGGGEIDWVRPGADVWTVNLTAAR